MNLSTRLVCAATFAAVCAVNSIAAACGGFFCNAGQPIDQTGEQILFIADGDRISAYIQIQYTGTAESFGWILPVPDTPTIEVSSDQLFAQLNATLQPQFSVNWRELGNCNRGQGFSMACGAADGATAQSDDESGGRNGVEVLSSEQVGPFDTVVLAATDTQALFEWLDNNDYDIPAETVNLTQPYIDMAGTRFVAVRLSKGQEVGNIQPLVVTYEADKPMIPIQLTAVAAQDDMGLLVHIVGPERAVPENYQLLELNPAMISWASGGGNYRSVVTAAADEAGGHGFATDYSGPVDSIVAQLEALQTLEPADLADANAFDVGFVLQNNGFQLDRELQQLIDDNTINESGLDSAGLYDAISERIVEPLEEAAAALRRQDVITRLFTTLDPEEMTMDPVFVFNGDLPEVDNVHTVEGVRDCRNNRFTQELRFDDGSTVTLGGFPGGPTIGSVPSLLRSYEAGDSGPPMLSMDRSEEVEEGLAEFNAANGGPVDDSGCATYSLTRTIPPGVLLIGLALLAQRRRSRVQAAS